MHSSASVFYLNTTTSHLMASNRIPDMSVCVCTASLLPHGQNPTFSFTTLIHYKHTHTHNTFQNSNKVLFILNGNNQWDDDNNNNNTIKRNEIKTGDKNDKNAYLLRLIVRVCMFAATWKKRNTATARATQKKTYTILKCLCLMIFNIF